MINWCEFQSYCMPIIVQKLIDRHGRDIDLLTLYGDFTLDTDYEFESIWEAIEAVCDFDYSEDESDYDSVYYISDENIREIYKLCLENRRFQVVEKFLNEVNRVVEQHLCFNSYCYDLQLPQNSDQKLESIKLMLSPEFGMYIELLEAILDTQDYIANVLPKLKMILWHELYKEQCSIKCLPEKIVREAA